MAGRIERIEFASRFISKGNSTSYEAPHAYAYVPEFADAETALPTVYVLAPWLSTGRAFLEWKPFRENFPQRLERLWKDKVIPPCVAVFPDLFTWFGGSQYINSPFFGGHGDYITEELIPAVEKKFPTNGQRYVVGRSSGGYGAIRFAMDKPGVFTGIACHSGDMGFEQMVRGDLLTLPRGLDRYKGDVNAFISYCKSADKLSALDTHLLMLLGSCGFYSPNEKSKWGFDLPVDLYSGEVIDKVWQQWLSHDPVVRIEEAKGNVAKLKKFYLECGLKDQYNLLYGARQLHAKLEKFGIKHRYEEFDDNHSGTDYRFDVSLKYLLV